MNIEELFNRTNIVDLSFFNFRNAITAAYFADSDLRILKVNDNFKSFFPLLGNVANVYFPDVLEQLGVPAEQIETFKNKMEQQGRVLIPQIKINIDKEEKVYSLLSTYTRDDSFSYLNGVQGQFVDRTEEYQLRKEREALLEEKLRAQQIIEDKSRQLEQLANRLAKYLAPQIYESIFSQDSEVKQSFARKNLTIFFSDVVGFTDISDRTEPEHLAFLVNTYLSEMSEIAMEFGGTIDKFIGDAILIFFGDPQSDGDQNDALRCVQMAWRMQQRISSLQDFWRSHGIANPLRVRMGINTGYCTVGNFGSEQRLDYTVLGGPVNLASRLQSLAEPGTTLLSEETYSLVREFVDCTRLDDMTPKGFVRPIGVYRLDHLKAELEVDDKSAPMKHRGRHVEVNVFNRNRIREAIEELRRIQEKFEQRLTD